MADLKIPNLNKKSDKYLFKKKLTLRRKSKRKLFNESLIMFLLSSLIIYLNFLIPDKVNLFKNISGTLKDIFSLLYKLSSLVYEVFLVIFILTSLILSITLLLGSLSRLVKIVKRRSSSITYK